MANFIKYFTNPIFNKPEFVRLLRYSMNVRAMAVDDGIILDLDAFNAISKAAMPHWIFINERYINSKLHTRPASQEEYKMAMKNDTINAEYVAEEEGKVGRKLPTNPKQEVSDINIKMIDVLLCALEAQADKVEFLLDDNAEYQRVCQIITSVEHDDPVTYEDKVFVRDALRDILFPTVGLNYEAVFRANFMTALP